MKWIEIGINWNNTKFYIPDESKYDWFYQGLIENIPLCCIMFFCFEWWTIKEKIPEYWKVKNFDEAIKCPSCIAKLILQ